MAKKGKKAAIIVSLLQLAAVSLTHAPAFTATQDVEKSRATTASEMPAEQQPDPKTGTDMFTIAIIGLSVGAMMITSSIHWNLSQRNHLASTIGKLDVFLSKTCSVDFAIESSKDHDPKIADFHQGQKRLEEGLRDIKEQRKVAFRSTIDVEVKLIKLWG